MQDSREPAALRAALQYVLSSEMPSEHKTVLIEALTRALRAEDSARTAREAAASARSEWSAGEVRVLEQRLAGRVATSWQDADEQLLQLAGELQRTVEDVRDKALEVGVGAGVDYRLAKKRKASEEDR